MSLKIINFHGIGIPHSWVRADEAKYWLTTEDFERALDRILETGHPFELTFDDGNRSDIEIGLPALEKRNLSATFFVCSDRTGRDGYLDSDAIRSLASTHNRIGTHGRAHVSWRNADSQTLADEVRGSKRAIEDLIGQPVILAGLPFGQYDRRVLSVLKANGFERIYSSDGLPRLHKGWVLPRYSMICDKPVDDQVDALVYGDSLSSRIKQEFRIAAKSLR